MATPIVSLDRDALSRRQGTGHVRRPYAAQHSRSASEQSSAGEFDMPGAVVDDDEPRFPDIIRLDMEFYMERLMRTASNESHAVPTG